MQEDNLSNDAAPVESAAPAPAAVETPAPSTETSAPESSKQTMLDAVLEVVQPTSEDGDTVEGTEKPEEPAEASPTEDAEEKEQAEEQTGEENDQEEERAAEEFSPKARRQINRLLRQRKELRSEMEQLKPVAEIGNQLQHFAVQHQLGSDDVINALHIAATLRRGDYKTFYDMMSPYVRHAQEYLGVVLPEDLQYAVQQGQMNEDIARQYARTRFDQQRMQIEREQLGQMSQQYLTNEIAGTVQRAVSSYEDQLAASDPDYKAKAGFVQRAAGAILREKGGTISSPEEAIAIVRDAYKEVNDHFRKISQPPRATPRTPGSTNSQTPAARAAPKNMMEAALAGLGRARAG